ncbi:MAG: hypothetical protein GXO49_06345 [Chlorobi bacterium]|nr:hypothetical protein [Chlorobiota bacterium]
MNSKIILILFLLFTFSCKNEDVYQKHIDGFEYKIFSNENNTQRINIDDLVELDLKYFSESDSLIFNSKELKGKFRVKVEDKENGGMFQTAICMLHIGDSASFLIKANDFYTKTIKTELPNFINKDEKLKIELKTKKIITQDELKKEYEQYIIKKEAEENILLQEYLKNENINVKPTKSGLYIIKLKKGKGEKAKLGDTATIHYKGSLINGQILASSINKGKPYTFKIGENKVIDAWNEALLTMKVGDKVKIIVPSKLAYGELGYKNKIPPFATLIFEIKLLKLK